MRILHISTRLILGGSQENTVLSCEGQARAGHEVHLAFGPIYGPEGSLLERVERFNTDTRARATHPPITTHVLPHMVREISPLKDHICFHHELRPLIRRLKPDVVHTHSSKAGILGRWAAWKETNSRTGVRPAIIHTIHGPPFMPVEGPLLARTKTRMMNYAYTIAERFAAKRCHAIVSVADAMTREFLARSIGRPEQYTTVRSGMDVGPFLNPAPNEDRASIRAALGLHDNDFVIGTVARLAQHKGHDDLLDALADDLKRNPHWKLLWVGDGWWRDRLVAKANSVGLQSQLVLTGLVPPTRIPALIRAMDVLAHPSYREGLPRTVPQALLTGVCPVAYDVDGTGEACRDMQTGRLVPLANLPALRAAITWCAEHPADRAALAARGQEECRVAFSTEDMVRQLQLVYNAAAPTPR